MTGDEVIERILQACDVVLTAHIPLALREVSLDVAQRHREDGGELGGVFHDPLILTACLERLRHMPFRHALLYSFISHNSRLAQAPGRERPTNAPPKQIQTRRLVHLWPRRLLDQHAPAHGARTHNHTAAYHDDVGKNTSESQ